MHTHIHILNACGFTCMTAPAQWDTNAHMYMTTCTSTHKRGGPTSARMLFVYTYLSVRACIYLYTQIAYIRARTPSRAAFAQSLSARPSAATPGAPHRRGRQPWAFDGCADGSSVAIKMLSVSRGNSRITVKKQSRNARRGSLTTCGEGESSVHVKHMERLAGSS